ncbi:hypothetical protein WMF45_45270 [Sorangium sp. So ce448]|uniref:hypothetical protein n=1 Tax=Sorangium sp. So ce448 TaxID=3133314 RepID=UPI003F5F5B4D
MRTTLEQREGWRYAILRTLYEASGGDQHRYFSLVEIGEHVGVPPEERELAWQYLIGEGLIRSAGMGPDLLVFITHRGRVEIETSMKNPKDSTDHFRASVIQHVTNNFSGPVGAVQTGSNNVANVTQNVSTDVQVLLQQLRAHVDGLPDEKRGEAIELVDGLDEQAKAPKKSKAIIRALLAGLGAIVTGAGGDVLAELGKKLLG